ncbi:MAG: oligosaccharide flippase family protein [Vulcanimicrobiaceae bacterium]
MRHGALVFGAATFVNIFTYVFHILALHRLSVSEYGTLSSMIAGLSITGALSMIFSTVLVKYAAEFHALDDRPKLRRLFEQSLRGLLGAAIVVFVAGVAFSKPLSSYLQLPSSGPIIAASAFLALSLVASVIRGILQGAQDFGPFAISTVIDGGGRMLFGISLVYLGFGPEGALAGFALGSFASLIYTIAAARARYAVTGERLLLDVRRLVRTTSGIAASSICLTTMGFFDVLLVKHFFTPDQAGLYSAVSLAGRGLFFVIGFLPAIVLPKATSKATNGENPIPILFQAGVATALMAGVVLVAFAVVPVQLIAGAKYAAAGHYIFEYGIAMTFMASATLVANYKIGLHRFDFVPVLAVVVLCEIIAVQFYHPSLGAVVNTLLIGHCIAFVASLYRINTPVPVITRNVAEPVSP